MLSAKVSVCSYNDLSYKVLIILRCCKNYEGILELLLLLVGGVGLTLYC